MTNNCRTAYKAMLKLNFQEARIYLDKEKQVQPENYAILYIENYIDFLKAFISEEQTNFSILKKNTDERISLIADLDNTSPWKRIAKAEMLLQLALVKLKWKEYLTSGYLLRKAYKLMEENEHQFQSFAPNLKSMGFFHAVIGAVPENYAWLSNLAGMKGTIKQGSEELDRMVSATEHDPSLSFMKDECYFIKIFVAMHFEKNHDVALNLLEKMKRNNPSPGPLHIFIESNSLMIAGKQDQSLQVLNSFSSEKNQFPFPYLHYLKGLLKLNQLNLDARNDFNKYVSEFKGTSFIKSAIHKNAWISFLKGDTVGYYQNLELVLKSGSDFTDEDKQANKDAENKELPNLILLRSRLYFDGGDYVAALAELASKPPAMFPRLKDQLEFTYRLARIFDKKELNEKAIVYYTKTFENGRNQSWYFAANSALLNGMLYEQLQKNSEAIMWYKKCLSLRNHEYQNSIDQKAEAGLNRLNNK